ncbi:MAG: hypothetical protein KKB70_11255 [Proteobacteria bacterium]|nr:hypothetical protein [Pseudomonadota bacterium]MBU1611781.1 hypothetical protein [Pseudomonadota bacterium]
MKRWKILAGLTALFLSGVIVGIALTGGFIHHMANSLMGDHGNENPMKMMMLKNIEHRLEPDQTTLDRINQELEVTFAELDAMKSDIEPRLVVIRDRFAQRCSAFLTKDQQAQLKQLMDDFQNHRTDKLQRPGWFMPPPPPPWGTSQQ